MFHVTLPRHAPLACLLFAVTPVFYAQAVGGTLSGTVTDPTGAAVPRAKVRIRNTHTGLDRRLATDSTGGYVAPLNPVGS